MDWYQVKMMLVGITGLHMDALHVHAGVLLQLGAALVLRRSIASPLPWMAVLAVALLNEGYDLRAEIWPTRDEQYAAAIKDMWNTMLLPTLLMLGCRLVPRLFHRGGRSAGDGD